VDPIAWGVLRFVVGLCMSGLYVTVESWLNDRASNANRGGLLSVYMLVVTLGLGLGQLMLGLADPFDTTLFILAGMLIALAVVPVAMIRIPTPSKVVPVKLSLRDLAHRAPLGVAAVAVAGAAGSSVIALGAVYGTQAGMDPARVGVFMAAFMVGGAVTQYPIGRLSDWVPRRRVILAMAIGATGVGLVGTFVDSSGPLVILVAAAYGSLVFPLYSVAVSHVNDVIPENQLVVAAAGAVFVFGIGSVIGPLSVSILMGALGPVGFFWGLALYCVPLAIYAFVRIVSKARPKQRRFLNLPPRSSTAALLLADPSKEDESV
jgi:MFS family permease